MFFRFSCISSAEILLNVINFEWLITTLLLIYVIFAVTYLLLLLVWRTKDPVVVTYNPGQRGGLHARVSRVKIIVQPLATSATS